MAAQGEAILTDVEYSILNYFNSTSIGYILDFVFHQYCKNWDILDVNVIRSQLIILKQNIDRYYRHANPNRTERYYLRDVVPIELFNIMLELGYLENNQLFKLYVSCDESVIRYGVVNFHDPKDVMILLYLLITS